MLSEIYSRICKFANGAATQSFAQSLNQRSQNSLSRSSNNDNNFRQNVSNGLTGIGGAAQITAGVAACATVVGCIAGIPLIVLGVSNVFESATGFLHHRGQGFSFTTAAIQRGFQTFGSGDSTNLAIKTNAVINLTADLIGLNLPSLAKNSFKLFRNISDDYVRVADNITNTGLLIQGGGTINTTINAFPQGN